MNNNIFDNVLINEHYLKLYSPIPKNFNIDEVAPYISVAESIWIKPIIGDALYDELLEQVNKDEITPENSTLLLQIYPLLGNATVYEGLPFIWVNVSEVGITLGNSENSNSITMKDLDYILAHLKNQIQVRQNELKKFLDDNAEFYPLYEVSHDCCKKSLNPFLQMYSPRKKNKILK